MNFSLANFYTKTIQTILVFIFKLKSSDPIILYTLFF